MFEGEGEGEDLGPKGDERGRKGNREKRREPYFSLSLLIQAMRSLMLFS
jgi:hypothetical protein